MFYKCNLLQYLWSSVFAIFHVVIYWDESQQSIQQICTKTLHIHRNFHHLNLIVCVMRSALLATCTSDFNRRGRPAHCTYSSVISVISTMLQFQLIVFLYLFIWKKKHNLLGVNSYVYDIHRSANPETDFVERQIGLSRLI